MNKKKIIKTILFITSAILMALILSISFSKNVKTYQSAGTTNIENRKNSILVGNKKIEELTINTNDNSTSNNIKQESIKKSPTESSNKKEVYVNEKYVTPQPTNKNDDLVVEFIENITSTSEENKEIFEENYVIPEEVVEQLENTGIKEIDAYFLKDIVNICDSITANYTLTLSYALTSDFEKGLDSLKYLKENIKSLNNLKVEDNDLKKVRDYVKEGANHYILGFEDYFNYGTESTNLFKAADTNFYNAQTILQEYLDSFR